LVQRSSKISLKETLSRAPIKKGQLEENAKGGIKDDQMKPIWSLLPFDALDQINEVLSLGALKYSSDNWRKVDRIRYVDAMMRHITAFLKGEVFDQDTGTTTHLAHAGCCALFLISLYDKEPFDKNELEAIFEKYRKARNDD